MYAGRLSQSIRLQGLSAMICKKQPRKGVQWTAQRSPIALLEVPAFDTATFDVAPVVPALPTLKLPKQCLGCWQSTAREFIGEFTGKVFSQFFGGCHLELLVQRKSARARGCVCVCVLTCETCFYTPALDIYIYTCMCIHVYAHIVKSIYMHTDV